MRLCGPVGILTGMNATDFSVPRVTTRAVIDHSRKCSLRCTQCYYRVRDDFYSVDPWQAVKNEVLAAKRRGCDCVEVTGGEPLEATWIVDLVKLCVEENLPARIITSLIGKESTIDELLDAGVADWLISMHGAREETHNAIVNVPKARKLQIRRMAKIAARMDYCVNYCLLEQTQSEMLEFAQWLVTRDHQPPKVVNFINFNVFGDWMSSQHWIDEGQKLVVDFRIAAPILADAIDLLEEHGIGVNCRYIPMCVMAERHRKTVCNDLHVAFDFGEWDNGIGGHDVATGERYARGLSSRNELQSQPCSGCGLKSICGGANKLWHKLAKMKFGCEPLTQMPAPPDMTQPAYWHYRQHNVLGLDPRRPAVDAEAEPAVV